MKLSYSSISNYLNCPLKYKFRHIDRMPTKKTSALSFGSSLHETLAFMYNVKTPTPPSLEEVTEKLKDEWLSEGYTSESEEKQYFAHANQVLKTFYQTNIDNYSLPVALEHKFNATIDDITVTGVIDRLDKIDEGRYEVIDYKTNRKLPPKSQIDKDLQLSIYYWATEQIWGFYPESVSLYFLLPNHKMSSTRNKEQLNETLDTIKTVADNISNEKFEPIKNNLCPWCDFQQYCPYFSDKFSKSSEEIKSLIDEYGDLKIQEKELKSKAKLIAQDLSAWLNDKKELRLFSDKYEILKNSRTTLTLDEENIIEILGPLNLLSEINSIENKKLLELLKTNKIDKITKEKIIHLMHKKTTFSLSCKEVKDK